MWGWENLYQQEIFSEHFLSNRYEMKLWLAKPGSYLYRRLKEKKSGKKKVEKTTCEGKSGGIRALAHTVKLAFALSCLHLVWYVQRISHNWL